MKTGLYQAGPGWPSRLSPRRALPECMGLATWLKQSRLKRMESKLKTLRTRQKHVRRKEEELANQRRAGSVGADEAKARERKLHEEKEKLTHEINALLVEEERLREELRREDALPAR